MLAVDQNALLTRVGPGTPMGALMRRYWQPIAVRDEMRTQWTKRVRLLGEDLVLFRDRQGRLGLIGEFCPHRRASLAFGVPTAEGIRCPYHGWMFDGAGHCLEQPNESGSGFKDKIKTTAYPVAELGGLVFAYLGPEPRPLLPRFDAYVAEPAIRILGRALVPCNWLQIMENSVDPVHTEWLHGHRYEFLKEQEGTKVAISAHHKKIGFTPFEYGIIKHRLLEGQSEDADDWRVGHPLVFPNVLSVGDGNASSRTYKLQIRVPVDDTHTLHLWYNAYAPPAGAVVKPALLDGITVHDVPYLDADGEHIIDFVDGQDIMAWVTQGPLADRSREHLGTTDVGVVLFRKMLRDELAKVERGEDPICVIRDPDMNRHIRLPVEKGKHHYSDGFAKHILRTQVRYSPIVDELIAVFDPGWSRARA